jgi:hypothetical protein
MLSWVAAARIGRRRKEPGPVRNFRAPSLGEILVNLENEAFCAELAVITLFVFT